MYRFANILKKGIFGTAKENKTSGGQRNKAVGLTEGNDEVEPQRPRIRPPYMPSSLPARHTDYGAIRDTYQITDPYPEPPESDQPRTSTRTTKRKAQGTDKDEARLLDTSRTQRDSTSRFAPGQEQPMSKKPGSDGVFRPRNTIDQEKYAGTARPSTRRPLGAGAARHPDGLMLESSRGTNVRHAQAEFPDERAAKRQKVEQASNGRVVRPSQMSAQYVNIDLSDDESRVEVRRGGSASRAKRSPTVQITRVQHPTAWEVSGTQESRSVDRMLKRAKRPAAREQDAHVSRQTNGHTVMKAPSQPAQSNDVVDISDDEQPAQLQETAVRTVGRPKRLAEKNLEADSRKKHAAYNEVVSSYFAPKPGRPRKSAKTVDAIDAIKVDAEDVIELEEKNGHRPSQTGRRREEQKHQSVADNDDEAVSAGRRSNSPRKSSPVKKIPGGLPATIDEKEQAVQPEEEDELHGGIRPSFVSGKSVATNPTAPVPQRPPKRQTKSKHGWLVEEMIDREGVKHDSLDFLDLNIITRVTGNYVTLTNPKQRVNLVVIECLNIQGIEWSQDTECRILRIKCPGSMKPVYDIKFHDHDGLTDFVAGLDGSTMLRVNNDKRTKSYMETVYGHGGPQRRAYDQAQAIDSGVEESLIAQRTEGKVNSKGRQSTRATTEGGRPRQARGLISQLKAQVTTPLGRALSKPLPLDDEGNGHYGTDQEIETTSSTRRSTRSRVTRKLKSPTPLSEYNRFSKTIGLGPSWGQPLVYPEEGKKRVTVDFKDLERLDEGEFINDNLLEFYMRWLQEEQKVPTCTVYFFNTHFYTNLANPATLPRGSKSTINFSAVERWTAKDDIFSHDFVVVPVNELHHWYVAIICNLPNVKRTLEAKEEGGASEDAPKDPHQAQGTINEPVEISEYAEGQPSAQQQAADEENQETTPTRTLTKKTDGLKLASSPHLLVDDTDDQAQAQNAAEEEDAEKDVKLAEAAGENQAQKHAADPHATEAVQTSNSQASTGVFSNATPTRTENKKKGRRKSGPPPRKYDTEQPMIVILDSMGGSHGRTISNLKDYLVEEARTKRGMEIDKNTFKGHHARAGIPQQQNYYDCGIYVCGYLHKFMEDPKEFGQKLMTQTFNCEVDWPLMDPEKMRDNMRTMLQRMAAEQQKLGLAKKAQKKAKKQVAAVFNAPKATAPVNNKIVDLSSPMKPSEAKQNPARDVQHVWQTDGATSETVRLQSKHLSPAKVRLAAKEQDEEEMLFPSQKEHQSNPPNKPDLLGSIGETLNKEHTTPYDDEDSQQQDCYVPDSQSQHARDAVNNFNIYDDSSAIQGTGAAPMDDQPAEEEEEEFNGVSSPAEAS